MYSFLHELAAENECALSKGVSSKLLPVQIKHTLRLVKLLSTNGMAIDRSDTGVGKTYIAAAICAQLNKIPIIICPKSLLHEWKRVMNEMGVKVLQIVNYETIRISKSYDNQFSNYRQTSNIIQSTCNPPYYIWNIGANNIVIFDEVQRCKEMNSINGKLLVSTQTLIAKGIPVLLLSATICEKYTDLQIPFFLARLIDHPSKLNSYLSRAVRVKKTVDYSPTEYKELKEKARMLHIYQTLQKFSSRIKINEMGNSFPKNDIFIQKFNLENTEIMNEAYKQLAATKSDHLPKIQKLKQRIELEKVPIFVKTAKSYLEGGYSVVIFVNYLKSLHEIAKFLNITCKIEGSQTLEERVQSIALFQNNKEKIIICQMRAGEVGISLHDLSGNHPRVSLINYPDSALTLIQVLGRTPRAAARSAVKQIIVFAANVSYEEKIARSMDRKLFNIDTINDGTQSVRINDLSLTAPSSTP